MISPLRRGWWREPQRLVGTYHISEILKIHNQLSRILEKSPRRASWGRAFDGQVLEMDLSDPAYTYRSINPIKNIFRIYSHIFASYKLI
jgi:hypothetical protein